VRRKSGLVERSCQGVQAFLRAQFGRCNQWKSSPPYTAISVAFIGFTLAVLSGPLMMPTDRVAAWLACSTCQLVVTEMIRRGREGRV
jgi:hypothetical protein